MAIASIQMVRGLAGGRTPQTVSDAKISEIIAESDAVVSMHTNKYDWDTDDADYNVVKRASELIAASDVRKMFGDKQEDADQMYNEALRLLELTTDKSSEVGGKAFMKRRAYRSWPANEHATPYLNEGYSASEVTDLGEIISL
jgi:hypothetical protein